MEPMSMYCCEVMPYTLPLYECGLVFVEEHAKNVYSRLGLCIPV